MTTYTPTQKELEEMHETLSKLKERMLKSNKRLDDDIQAIVKKDFWDLV